MACARAQGDALDVQGKEEERRKGFMNHVSSCMEFSKARQDCHAYSRHSQKGDENDRSQCEYSMLLAIRQLAHDTGNARKVEQIEGKKVHIVEHGSQQRWPLDPKVDEEGRRHLIETDENLEGKEGREMRGLFRTRSKKQNQDQALPLLRRLFRLTLM